MFEKILDFDRVLKELLEKTVCVEWALSQGTPRSLWLDFCGYVHVTEDAYSTGCDYCGAAFDSSDTPEQYSEEEDEQLPSPIEISNGYDHDLHYSTTHRYNDMYGFFDRFPDDDSACTQDTPKEEDRSWNDPGPPAFVLLKDEETGETHFMPTAMAVRLVRERRMENLLAENEAVPEYERDVLVYAESSEACETMTIKEALDNCQLYDENGELKENKNE